MAARQLDCTNSPICAIHNFMAERRDYRAAVLNTSARSLDEVWWWLRGYYALPHHFRATEKEFDLSGEVFRADLLKKAQKTTDFLRRCVDSWVSADCRFDKWETANLPLLEEINRNLKSTYLQLHRDSQSNPHLATIWRLGMVDRNPIRMSLNPHKEAAWLFCQLLTSPLRDRIRKCKRCQKYFLAESLRMNKVFCSRKCATGFTASDSTRKRRLREKQDRIRRVRDAMVWLDKIRKRPPDWKDCIADRADVTRKWLTRALRRGDLLPWTDKE